MKKLFGKKKKKEEIVQPEEVPEPEVPAEPEAEEPEETLPEPEEIATIEKEAELAKTKAWLKKNKEAAEATEPKGKFSIDIEEMALFAQLAASSEEYKIYQQGLVGQRLDKIVTEYNKAVGDKSEPEDTDEERLPE